MREPVPVNVASIDGRELTLVRDDRKDPFFVELEDHETARDFRRWLTGDRDD